MKWVFWASRVFTPMRILLGLNKIEKDRLKPKGPNRTGLDQTETIYILWTLRFLSSSFSVSWLDFSLTRSHCTTVSLSVRYHRCYLPPSASPIFKFFSEWQFTLAWPGTFASAEWLVQHPSLMEKPMMHCIRQVCQFTSYSLVCYY